MESSLTLPVRRGNQNADGQAVLQAHPWSYPRFSAHQVFALPLSEYMLSLRLLKFLNKGLDGPSFQGILIFPPLQVHHACPSFAGAGPLDWHLLNI